MSQFRTLQQLACIPRGDSGELRIELTECADDRGSAAQFVNVRLWFRGDSGQMMPGKQGITIRQNEIHDFGRALRAALNAMNGKAQPEAKPRPQRPADDYDPEADRSIF